MDVSFGVFIVASKFAVQNLSPIFNVHMAQIAPPKFSTYKGETLQFPFWRPACSNLLIGPISLKK